MEGLDVDLLGGWSSIWDPFGFFLEWLTTADGSFMILEEYLLSKCLALLREEDLLDSVVLLEI